MLICGDCRDELRNIESESVDLVVADPPYGNVTKEHWDKIDNYYEFSQQWLAECHRILKPTGSIYVWCSIGPKSSSLLDIAKILKETFVFQDMIVWGKQRGRGNRKGWLFTREEILWATKSKDYVWNAKYQYSTEKYEESWLKRFRKEAEKNGKEFRPYKRATNVWKDISEVTIENVKESGTKGSRQVYHPNQKPFRAIERIILAHTKPGDFIVDPFGGSGTTAIVCKYHERNCTIIEREVDLCEIIRTRLEN